MITSILLIFIGAFALLQPNAPRLFAALIFAGLTLAHDFFSSNLDGLMYYGSAALIDLFIIILTSGISPVPKMVITLHKICMVSIVANFFGWVIWTLYYPPIAYDLAFMAIYAWTLITFITRGKIDVGGFTLDSWYSCLRFNNRSRLVRNNKDGSAA